jgi:alpha-1,2-mannosyltransferase
VPHSHRQKLRNPGSASRTDGLILVFIGATVVLLILGFLLKAQSPGSVHDFISSYYATRCLVHHHDPYLENEILKTYQAEGGDHSFDDPEDRATILRYVYPPSTFVAILPFAVLPWSAAHVLWALVSAGSLIVAGFLAWDLGAEHAPVLCGALVAYLLANSEIIVVLGNPSALMIGLCIFSVWSFLRERFVAAGILCLALSLAIKPQGPALVWLFFLLVGGVFRKRAILVFIIAVLISLPMVVWVTTVAPHWMQELHANIQSFSGQGGPTDPGPASTMRTEFLDLQVVISRFFDSPTIYNLISYSIMAPILLAWAAITARSGFAKETAMYALASVASLSMLPVYHHYYDTKLILLCIPAVAALWVRRDRFAWIAVFLSAGSLFFTGDLSHWLVTHAAIRLQGLIGARFADALMVFPAPLILLTMGSFYLWIYWQASRNKLMAAV